MEPITVIKILPHFSSNNLQNKFNVTSDIHEIQVQYLKMEVDLKTLKCVLWEKETKYVCILCF